MAQCRYVKVTETVKHKKTQQGASWTTERDRLTDRKRDIDREREKGRQTKTLRDRERGAEGEREESLLCVTRALGFPGIFWQ